MIRPSHAYRKANIRAGAFDAPGVRRVATDRRIDSTIVKCPTCEAKIGDRCHTLKGNPSTKLTHQARRRMAVRRLREIGEIT